MADLSVRLAAEADRRTLERLWLLFRHDMSEWGGTLPNPDGTFRSERLESALTDPGWAAYLFQRPVGGEQRPVGFAFVRGLDGPTRVLNSFFVVRGVRRGGVGLGAVAEVLARHPGAWEVAFQDANAPAVRFWHRVAGQVAGEACTEERRPVPGKPEVPPDVWISFEVAADPTVW